MSIAELAPAPILRTGDPDEPMKSHLICAICYPRGTAFPTAACGETVLGIGGDGERPHCDDCTQLDAKPYLPCGH